MPKSPPYKGNFVQHMIIELTKMSNNFNRKHPVICYYLDAETPVTYTAIQKCSENFKNDDHGGLFQEYG